MNSEHEMIAIGMAWTVVGIVKVGFVSMMAGMGIAGLAIYTASNF